MNVRKEIPEVSSLRWLANMFPWTENPHDETDRMTNAINIYTTAGANKIEELSEVNERLLKELEELKKKGK